MNETQPLTLIDRCDRCGAQAFVRATFESGPILLCGHHYTAHHKVLAQKALFVHEELANLKSR